jgi:ABC-type transport system involved in cytochrome bd biosynthesis fused ATPase/permease subunit
MNAVLGQIAVAVGGLLFIVVFAWCVATGVPVLVAIFRASVVMCLSTLIVAVFFRFLSSVLRKFVIEKIQEHNKAKAARGAAGRRQPRTRPAAEEPPNPQR